MLLRRKTTAINQPDNLTQSYLDYTGCSKSHRGVSIFNNFLNFAGKCMRFCYNIKKTIVVNINFCKASTSHMKNDIVKMGAIFSFAYACSFQKSHHKAVYPHVRSRPLQWAHALIQ